MVDRKEIDMFLIKIRAQNLIFVIFSLFLLQANGWAKGKKLAEFLPVETEITPWETDGDFQTYNADHLQDYLDGGADIYLEYGFQDIGVQSYKNGNGLLQVEIYRMKSPEAALGIFSYRRHFSPDSALDVPNEISRYDILFQKNCYFVAITNMDGGAKTAQALKVFAMSILRRIPEGKMAKNPFDQFPRKNLQPSSEMIIAGPLSMRVRWPLGRLHCFHFERGTKAAVAKYKSDGLSFDLFIVHPGKRAGFYQLVECFGNIFNATMIVKSNKKIVMAMMNSKKTIFLKKGKDVWIIPDLFDDRPVLKFLGEN